MAERSCTGASLHVQTFTRIPTTASHDSARRRAYRSGLGVPMLREGRRIGAIDVSTPRRRSSCLSRQVALLQTFADQAVIAIENVRLFTELEARNRELRVGARAADGDQRAAQGDRAVHASTSSRSSRRWPRTRSGLCEAERAFILRFDGQLSRLAASHNVSPELRAFVERNPIAPGRHSATAARAALERRTVHIHDAQADPSTPTGATEVGPVRTGARDPHAQERTSCSE